MKYRVKFYLCGIIFFFFLGGIMSGLSLFNEVNGYNMSVSKYNNELNTLGISWSQAELVSIESTSDSYFPSVEIDKSGNIYVVWEDKTAYSGSQWDWDIFYKYRDINTGYWSPVEVVSIESTGDSWNPAIAVDDSGNVHVTWEDYSFYGGSGWDKDIFYKRWNSTTKTWTSVEVISIGSTSGCAYPTIAVDLYGNVHIAWSDWLSNEERYGWYILYKYWTAADGSWSTIEPVFDVNTSNSDLPSIKTDAIGNVHIAWTDYRNYKSSGMDSDIYYNVRNSTTNTWGVTEVVSKESSGDSSLPKIVITDSGEVHITWEDKTAYEDSGIDLDIFYKYRDVLGSWKNTETVSTESTDDSWHPTLAVDNHGKVHIVWRDATNYNKAGTDWDIFYKYRDNNTAVWSETEVVSKESNSMCGYPVIVVDNLSYAHILWEDYMNVGDTGSDMDIFYKKQVYNNENPYDFPLDNILPLMKFPQTVTAFFILIIVGIVLLVLIIFARKKAK